LRTEERQKAEGRRQKAEGRRQKGRKVINLLVPISLFPLVPYSLSKNFLRGDVIQYTISIQSGCLGGLPGGGV